MKNSAMINQPDDFLFDPNPEIGGAIVPLIGAPGSGKTNAGVNIVKQNFQSGHIGVWKGSKEAQWIALVANDVPVKVWNHESMEEFEAYVTAKGPEDDPMEIDFNEHQVESCKTGEEMQAIEVDTWQDPEELINNLDTDRVNVINVPGLAQKTEFKHPKYFYMKTWKDILYEMKERRYLQYITFFADEINDIAPPQQQAKNPYNKIVSDQLPPIYAQLRKNNVLMYGAGHATHDMHYTFWGVKSNARINMAGANIKHKLDPGIDQDIVNNLDRGEFVMSGYEKSRFALLKQPKDLSWIGDEEDHYAEKFRLDWDAEVPDYLGEKKDAENDQAVDKGQVILNQNQRLAYKLTQDPWSWTQDQIAEFFDRDQSQVSRWIRDQKEKRAEAEA